MKTVSIYKITIVLLIIPLLTLSSCSNNTSNHGSKSGLYFDTVVSVDIYGVSDKDAGQILDECMSICDKYEKLFNKNITTSDIAKINSSGGQSVHVDHDTVELIDNALYYCKSSNGLFDITIDPVSSLWDFHGDNNTVPDSTTLNRACSHVDYRNITIDEANDTITLADPESSIDIGAAAKGFIADKIAEYLLQYKITGAIINMGGDMRLIGTKPDNSLFNIGINDPENGGSCIMSLYISDMSVATSGTYERCFTSGGKTYHHILDPATGYSTKTDIRSVTVITNSSLASDCLCTVSILKGSDEAYSMIEQLPDTEAVFILNDGSVIKTPGANKYIRN